MGAAGLAGILLYLRDRRERRRTERLAAASLESLLGAIDANDEATGAHVRRVAWYATLLAQAAGLREKEVRAVERVALFHDIGKIHAALFDIIHDGDDNLSSEERERVATHPRRGAEVLRPLGAFYPELSEGVLSHHERWDGTGYPRGLQDTAIPLTARVVAIADTFDAITTGRRYRAERSLEEARRTITEGRGRHFDPGLADVFLRPDVQRRAEDAIRLMSAQPRETGRRGGSPERRHSAPDITFRWRDAAVAPSPPGLAPRRGP